MKAYQVYDCNSPECCLLIFHETANKARYFGLRKGPYEWDEYKDMRAKRVKKWDKFAVKINIIEENEQLPVDAEPFYWDEYY